MRSLINMELDVLKVDEKYPNFLKTRLLIIFGLFTSLNIVYNLVRPLYRQISLIQMGFYPVNPDIQEIVKTTQGFSVDALLETSFTILQLLFGVIYLIIIIIGFFVVSVRSILRMRKIKSPKNFRLVMIPKILNQPSHGPSGRMG